MACGPSAGRRGLTASGLRCTCVVALRGAFPGHGKRPSCSGGRWKVLCVAGGLTPPDIVAGGLTPPDIMAGGVRAPGFLKLAYCRVRIDYWDIITFCVLSEVRFTLAAGSRGSHHASAWEQGKRTPRMFSSVKTCEQQEARTVYIRTPHSIFPLT